MRRARFALVELKQGVTLLWSSLTASGRPWHGCPMPREARIQHPGATHHLTSRGNRRQDIFLDAVGRQDFLRTLAQTCQNHPLRAFLPSCLSPKWRRSAFARLPRCRRVFQPNKQPTQPTEPTQPLPPAPRRATTKPMDGALPEPRHPLSHENHRAFLRFDPGSLYGAIHKVVAQISKSALSQVSNLRGASKFRPPADLQIGDTAGLEACATLR